MYAAHMPGGFDGMTEREFCTAAAELLLVVGSVHATYGTL
jgi:hypothetical protein